MTVRCVGGLVLLCPLACTGLLGTGEAWCGACFKRRVTKTKHLIDKNGNGLVPCDPHYISLISDAACSLSIGVSVRACALSFLEAWRRRRMKTN